MTYGFKATPAVPNGGDGLIATALNGVVYTENSRLHVKGNAAHYIYKPEGSPVGWYARNIKTCDDIFLGAGASPTINLENVEVENEEMWGAIKQEDAAAEEPKE